MQKGVIELHAAELFKLFEKNVLSNPDFYYADYLQVKEAVSCSSARYKGKPVEFLYQPMFFTAEDIDRFNDLTSTLISILKKVISEYLANPVFRRCFDFPRIMEELILVDPGYGIKFPVARFDVFYPYNDNIKFCELNADGTSCMNESMVLHEIFKESKAIEGINGIKREHKFFDYELFDSWIDAIIHNYKEFNCGVDDQPNIAIMDFEGEGITSEFEVFQGRFMQRGYNTVICDPRSLRYVSDKLYYNNQKIDLVYRRATTTRIVEEVEHVKDFIKAYKDRAVCVVGGLVSQIIHNKQIFAVLHDQEKLPFLNEGEIAFINKHIPYTVTLDSCSEEQIERVLENKDSLVLKPFDRFAAYGVYIGKDYNYKEWKALVVKAKREDYLVQEFCSVPQLRMPTVKDKRLCFENYNYMVGLFVYNQQFSGLYTRASRKNIIASIVESFTLPNFILRDQT